MPRDGGWTQNRQKSATDGAARAESSGLELCRVVTEENEVKYDCRQKKKMQRTTKTIFQFFVYSHSLTRIFADSCDSLEASEVRLPFFVPLGIFIFAVLCISL